METETQDIKIGWLTTSHTCSDKCLTCWTNFQSSTNNKLSRPYPSTTYNLPFNIHRFKAQKESKNTNSHAYRQRLGYSYLDLAEHGPLQGLDSILQAGVLQVGGVNVHESVSWQQSAILLRYAIGDQRANHNHCLGRVQRVLWQSRSRSVRRGQQVNLDLYNNQKHTFLWKWYKMQMEKKQYAKKFSRFKLWMLSNAFLAT